MAAPSSLIYRRLVCCAVAMLSLLAGSVRGQEGSEPTRPEASAYGSLSSCDYCEPTVCTSYFAPPAVDFSGDTRIYRSVFLGRLWFEAEYLAWASSKTEVPTLINEVTNSLETPAFISGAIHDEIRSGGRLTWGYWFTPEHQTAIQVNFFEIDGHNLRYAGPATGTTVKRAVTSGSAWQVEPQPFAKYPELEFQSLTARSDMDLLGTELLWRQVWRGTGTSRCDWLAGYRYVRLYDGLSLSESWATPDDSTDNALDIDALRVDDLNSKNEFHGGELGLIGRWWGCRWAVQTLGKIAIGGTRTTTRLAATETIAVGNSLTVNTLTDPTTDAGRTLVYPSSTNQYAQSQFAAVAELGLRVEYAMTKQCRASLGYSLMYWSRVARVLDAISPMAGISSEFAFHNDDFWAHGLTAGLQYDF